MVFIIAFPTRRNFSMSSIHQSFCGSSKQSANCRQLKNAKVIISILTILLSFQVSKKSRNFSKIGKQFNVWLEVPVLKATSLVTKSGRRERDSKFIKGLYKWLFWDSYYSWGWCLGHQPWTIVGESWGAWEKFLKLGGGKKRRHLKDRSAKITFFTLNFGVLWYSWSDS